MVPYTTEKSIAFRCCNWNMARYEQELDPKLAYNLLLEELLELFRAEEDFDTLREVEQLDACGDIVFVAIGILWKAGLSPFVIHNIIYGAGEEIGKASPITLINHMNSSVQYLLGLHRLEGGPVIAHENTMAIIHAMHAIFITVPTFLLSIGYEHRFNDIVLAICDSNDTKSVEGKTPSNVKANISKGPNYVSPTKALELIVHEVHQEVWKEV